MEKIEIKKLNGKMGEKQKLSEFKDAAFWICKTKGLNLTNRNHFKRCRELAIRYCKEN
jgi:hypothetical protein